MEIKTRKFFTYGYLYNTLHTLDVVTNKLDKAVSTIKKENSLNNYDACDGLNAIANNNLSNLFVFGTIGALDVVYGKKRISCDIANLLLHLCVKDKVEPQPEFIASVFEEMKSTLVELGNFIKHVLAMDNTSNEQITQEDDETIYQMIKQVYHPQMIESLTKQEQKAEA